MVGFVTVGVLENEIEWRLIESVLKERGIPHRLNSYHDTANDGPFQAQRGWGDVEVPEGFHREALEILEDIRQGGGFDVDQTEE